MTELLILGVGITQSKHNGLERFKQYCHCFDLEYQIVGDGVKWIGGDLEKHPGGGQKIIELEKHLRSLPNRLILVCDTFDLIPAGSAYDIVSRYKSLCPEQEILFSSEVFCWPDSGLNSRYPIVNTKYRYLNSGSFMGMRDDIYRLIENHNISAFDDDQLFFTHCYLNFTNLKLDHQCKIFQALNGATEDIIIQGKNVFNKYTNTYPLLIHGNGPSKKFLNEIENYWFNDSAPSRLFIAIYINSEHMAIYHKFINNFVNYYLPSGSQVHFYDEFCDYSIKEFVELLGYQYHSYVKKFVYEDFLLSDCDHYLIMRHEYHVTDKMIVDKLLNMLDETHWVIAPMLNNYETPQLTNFWGDVTTSGYYKRSSNYFDIAYRNILGLWNVPYVSGMIMIKGSIIRDHKLDHPYHIEDPDINLCYQLRKNQIFMYVSNYEKYGKFS